MTPNDKTARLLTKLIDQTKADAKTIEELRAAISTAATVATESQREAGEAKTQRDAAEHLAHELRAVVGQQCKIIDDQSCKLASTTAALRESQAEIAAVRTVMTAERVAAAENANLIEKLQPRLDALEQARADLTTLCDGVRARMRRKEQEAEQAILNRRLVAGSRPDLNRR